MAKLNDKQMRFVLEYIVDGNGTQAAIRAGYAPRAAKVTASRLLTNTNVQAELVKRKAKLEKKLEITAERVLQELALIGFSRVTDYLAIEDGQVQIKDTNDMNMGSVAALAGIKQGPHGIEIKLYDKQKALELLGRHLGIFKEKVEISGNLSTNNEKLDNLVAQLYGGDSSE